MKAAVLVLVVVAAAVAVPMQWLELEKARTITKGPRLGEVYSFCSEFHPPNLRTRHSVKRSRAI